MIKLIGIALSLCVASTAQAEILASYYTTIGPADRVNSSGAPLTDFGAILQQDRANAHRFGRPNPGDERDPFFGVRKMRAAIPTLFARGGNGGDYWRIQANSPYDITILVFICGSGGRPAYLKVNPADGDGYSGC
ncbi:hypothetical protein [Sedimentitalea todarodis]|uniref:Uncharacterized protein n=1 Tax=Sedimentitalea todarodis TaxID=1631240 RepID=A0ABU3VE52_9RHOB|nr:hypothetical protein [Sedimentitalea todarodis]MDU9004441.1 hypothetical protein [Sedimentitalea todarodis]